MIYTVSNTAAIGIRARVFVNGNEVAKAYYADTTRGIVRFYPQPLRFKKPERDRAYSRTLKGSVTVELLDRA